jgi:hypothetical protein
MGLTHIPDIRRNECLGASPSFSDLTCDAFRDFNGTGCKGIFKGRLYSTIEICLFCYIFLNDTGTVTVEAHARLAGGRLGWRVERNRISRLIFWGGDFAVEVVQTNFNCIEISVGGDKLEQEETNQNKETWQNRCTQPGLC